MAPFALRLKPKPPPGEDLQVREAQQRHVGDQGGQNQGVGSQDSVGGGMCNLLHRGGGARGERQQRFQWEEDSAGSMQEVAGSGRDGRLRSVWDFPAPLDRVFPAVFPHFDTFNSMQTAVVDRALTDKTLVVVSPTGSGKTAVFEMCICHLFASRMDGRGNGGEVKAIFLAPAKFLVNQKMTDWKEKFGDKTLKLSLAELTGDTSTSLADCMKADIILATPEKWDSTTRRWRDSAALISKIKLFMVDEVHTVGDDSRGPCLEAVMVRMKTIRAFQQAGNAAPLRIVAVSATVPNPEDLGEWLGAEKDYTCVFGDEHRPVPLSYHVIGAPRGNRNEFVFDKNLNFKIPDIIRQYGQGRPVLVFCSTRKSAEEAATRFAAEVKPFLTADHKQMLWDRAAKINTVKHKSLRDVLHVGVGFHNGALEGRDRSVAEGLFCERALVCLFTTSTLAVGANLPAFLVIIKGTLQYQSGSGSASKGWSEYDAASIQQMAGRAGRKGYDEEGRAVVLTDEVNVDMYRNILSCKKPIESFLHKSLIEHLNSEIVLETITDISSVLDWAQSTLLWVRAKKVPNLYFPNAVSKEDNSGTAERKIQDLIRKLMLEALNKLMSTNIPIVKSLDEDGLTFAATELGATMAKFYIAFSSMESMQKLTQTTSVGEMIVLVSEMAEFKDFHCRTDQKKLLEAFNKHSGVMYKVVKKSGTGGWTTARKVECLMQCAIGGVPIENWSLRAESQSICDAAARVTHAITEYCISQRLFSTCAKSVKLHQAIVKKTWQDDNTGRLLTQLKGVGTETAKKLSGAGIITLKDLDKAGATRVDMVLGKQSGIGQSMIKELRSIPCFVVSLKITENSPAKPVVKCEATVQAQNWDGPGYQASQHRWHCKGILLVGFKNGSLILSRRFNATTNPMTYTFEFERSASDGNEEVIAHAMHESFVGRDGIDTAVIHGMTGSTGKRPMPETPQPPTVKKPSPDDKKKDAPPEKKIKKESPTKHVQYHVHVGGSTGHAPGQTQAKGTAPQTPRHLQAPAPQKKPDSSLHDYLRSVTEVQHQQHQQQQCQQQRDSNHQPPRTHQQQIAPPQIPPTPGGRGPARPAQRGGTNTLFVSGGGPLPPPTPPPQLEQAPGRKLADLTNSIEELDRFMYQGPAKASRSGANAAPSSAPTRSPVTPSPALDPSTARARSILEFGNFGAARLGMGPGGIAGAGGVAGAREAAGTSYQGFGFLGDPAPAPVQQRMTSVATATLGHPGAGGRASAAGAPPSGGAGTGHGRGGSAGVPQPSRAFDAFPAAGSTGSFYDMFLDDL